MKKIILALLTAVGLASAGDYECKLATNNLMQSIQYTKEYMSMNDLTMSKKYANEFKKAYVDVRVNCKGVVPSAQYNEFLQLSEKYLTIYKGAGLLR